MGNRPYRPQMSMPFAFPNWVKASRSGARNVTIMLLLAAPHTLQCQRSPVPRAGGIDTALCRIAALQSLRALSQVINRGDTALLNRIMTQPLGVVSFGRNGWREPFFSTRTLAELKAYVVQQSHRRVRITGVNIHQSSWFITPQRLGFLVSFTRESGAKHEGDSWLGKGEYICGRGLHILNAAPQS